MKKTIFIALSLFFLLNSISYGAAEKQKIEAKIKNLKDSEIVVKVYDISGKSQLLDTIIHCKNGQFSFDKEFSQPAYATFVPKSGLLDTKQIRGVVERGTMTIGIYMMDGEKYSVTGNLNGNMLTYDAQGSEINSVISKLRTKYLDSEKYIDMENEYFRDNKTKAQRDSLYYISEAIEKKRKVEELEFVKNNLKSQLSGLFLSNQGYTDFDQYYSLIDESVREGVFKQLIDKKKYTSDLVRNSRKMVIGADGIDFSLKGLDGKSITLSSLKGKNVLLYFWGSW